MGETINAWVCKTKGGPLVKEAVEKCTWTEDMVDMDVICCGVCGTDIHCIDDGWGPTEHPAVMGHEVIGTVTRVGKNVKHLKEGDRAGVGCQSGACLKCSFCKDNKENLCEKHAIWTFNDRYDVGDGAEGTKKGEKTYGGFAEKWRGCGHFAVKIPDSLESTEAASLLCGGVTTYAPLKRFHVGQGSTVAVLGLGGLGHFGIQWAKAMGATVVAFDVIPDKVNDAKKLGCDDYVLMNDEEHMKKWYGKFTHVLATKIVNKCWDQYINMMRANAVFMLCDIPEQPISGLNALSLCGKQIVLAGTFIGPPSVIQECIDFASTNKIHTMVNTHPMDDINGAIQFVRDGKPRYRCVVTNGA